MVEGLCDIWSKDASLSSKDMPCISKSRGPLDFCTPPNLSLFEIFKLFKSLLKLSIAIEFTTRSSSESFMMPASYDCDIGDYCYDL